MKRILITGASGFIGSEVTSRLSDLGHEICILSRDAKKIAHLRSEKIKAFEVDLLDPSTLYEIKKELEGIETVIHLGASVSYFGSMDMLKKANAISSANLYNWSKSIGVKRFVFASSIEAMGTRGRPSHATEKDLVKPVSSYGESKLLAERALIELNKDNGIDLIILRIGNVYGPRGSFFIVPFANALLKKDKYLKYCPAFKDQVFQLIYIDDIVEGIIKAVEGEDDRGTYILAGEETMSIEDIWKAIGKELNIEYKTREIPPHMWIMGYLRSRKKILEILHRADLLSFLMAGEEMGERRTFSIEKAKEELRFTPKIKLEEGIRMTLKWAKGKGLLYA